MQSDTFGLRDAIKKLERGKSIGIVLYVVAPYLGAWLLGWALTGLQIAASAVVSGFFAAIWLEARETRIEILRASLRQVVMQRDPSIVHGDDW